MSEDAFEDAVEEFNDAGGDDYEGTYALHRAAFYNDAAAIARIVRARGAPSLDERDVHGNAPLHVAALRRSTAAAAALLDAGAAPDAKSGRGWTPLEEALAARDHATSALLHHAALAAARARMKARRAELLRAMRAMPDYTMRLSWRLGSAVPGLGLLLRRYAPADTYTLWKVGDCLRVDGTLMGVDAKSASLIPEWKRGHFSLVMDGRGCADGATSGGGGGSAGGAADLQQEQEQQPTEQQPSEQQQQEQPPQYRAPRLLFLHHTKQRWVDLGADRKAAKADEAAAEEEELLQALERDVDKQRLKARGVTFAPLRGWFGGDVTERVEGWQCRVYEAAGRVVGVSTSKARWGLPAGAAFDDYLAFAPPADGVAEVALDPLNPAGALGAGGGGGGGGADSPRGRRGDSPNDDDDGDSDGDDGSDGDDDTGDDNDTGPDSAGWWGSSAGAGSSSGSRARVGGGQRSSTLAGDNSGSSSADADAGDDDDAERWADAIGDVPPRQQTQEQQRRRRRRHADGLGTIGGRHRTGSRASSPPRKQQPNSSSTSTTTTTKAGSNKAGGGRALRARLWMAAGFPMSLAQLVPLLEVVGAANKHVARVGRFMARYAGLDLFPVRVQVPLVLTVHAVVGFGAFERLDAAAAPGPEFFEVPEGYARRTLNDMVDKTAGGLLAGGPSRRRAAAGDDDDHLLRDLDGDLLDW